MVASNKKGKHLVWKKTSGAPVTGSNPLTYEFNMNSDMVVQDFGGGVFSFVVQALGTRSSAGAVITF